MPRPENWPRTILHVDLDAFYTSVHQRDDPKLRGVPLAVAGRSRRAVVMGASYEARAFGVRSAMPLHEALQLCPQLIVATPDGARYREASRLVHQIFRRFTSPELVEGIALDEAYLDVTARTRHGTSTADEVSRRVKFQIHTEVGLTASVGAATSKLVAKVASGTRKPDGLVLVPPGTEADFLAPLPVGVIPGLGPKTEDRLQAMGLRTVGALAGYETQRLVQALGTNGAVLQRLAQGRDRAPVDGSRPAKAISAGANLGAERRRAPAPAPGPRPRTSRRQPAREDDLGRDDLRDRRERPGPARARPPRPDRPRHPPAQDRRRPGAHRLREAEAPGLQAGEPPGEPDEPDRRRRDDLPRRPVGAGEVARGVAAGALDRGWPVWARAPRARPAADALRLTVRSTTGRGSAATTSPTVVQPRSCRTFAISARNTIAVARASSSAA